MATTITTAMTKTRTIAVTMTMTIAMTIKLSATKDKDNNRNIDNNNDVGTGNDNGSDYVSDSGNKTMKIALAMPEAMVVEELKVTTYALTVTTVWLTPNATNPIHVTLAIYMKVRCTLIGFPRSFPNLSYT